MRQILKYSAAIILFISLYTPTIAQQVDLNLFNCMQWRMIGPHRGGRTVGAVGVPQQPNVFYIGVNDGGVWKTNDYGRTWNPIFDDQPTGSIGDVIVAPSNPNVVYVGTGEGIQRPDLSLGNGVYKSTDAGKTWTNIGLKDGQQIGGLAIDPKDENRLFAAVLGHPYGPNTERGVYRTTDGGKTWERVLYKDENTGAIQVTIDPNNSNIVYADLWEARQGPWEDGEWHGPESGLFKSTDGGTSWKKLTNGLPSVLESLGRIGFCIAPSNSNRMYATVDAAKDGGIYRSDDAGESWYLINSDWRLWGRGDDFAEIKVDPFNPDIVYTANIVVWKSIDGGKTWTGFRGAPGGDDYHRIWINPTNSNIILIASDQGAIITVNGGETFSSWYNQPTAQFYHVSADNSFPYNVYSGQQESGSVGIASRGNDGQITFREWHPVGVEEYGYVVADPNDPNIIYGGKISKYDRRTGQTQNISPEAIRSGKYRFIRTAPILFNPIDHKTLYYAGNVLFKTEDGGESWKIISPDLSRESWDIPASVGIYSKDEMKKMPRRGVIYTVAPSYVDINTIWCGTDDGLIHVTRDGGKTWKNVTPPEITSWSKISLMEASHTDVNTAYAAVNCIRLDDMSPHIYKTSDGGKTWKEIVNGLPNHPINVVKEDTERKGLLFAGSETGVYVSFDDGENWQSLRLNMPATSIRDLIIKDNDLVAATHGRSFWILDDITPLQQISSESKSENAILYKPETAIRVRWDMNTDTPLPQEEPAGQNPPEGAIIDYYLNAAANDVSLEILDPRGSVVRKYSNHDPLYEIPKVNIPLYWIRPQQILSAEAGSHRFMWDMRYTPLDVPVSYPMSAIYKNTAPAPTSPWVMPGLYTIKLTVDGKQFTQTLKINMDPRVKTSTKDLQLQHDLSFACYENAKKCLSSLKEIADKKNEKLAVFEKDFNKYLRTFSYLQRLLQQSDMPPTSQLISAVKDSEKGFEVVWNKWKSL
ncbi:MAG: glycoside hydrolase [Bacteroidota bacterium]